MPGNLPVPQGVQIRILWNTTTGGTSAITVLHARNGTSTVIDQALTNTIETTFYNQFTSSALGAQVVPSVLLQHVGLRDMSSNSNIEFLGTGTPVAGTAAVTTPLPPNVSVCVSGLTGLRGPSFRSRTYLWGYSTSAVSAGGLIGGPAQAASTAFMNGLRTALAGLPNPLPLVVLSRFTTPPGAESPIERNPPIMTNITNYVLKDVVFDTQRRRAIPGV